MILHEFSRVDPRELDRAELDRLAAKVAEYDARQDPAEVEVIEARRREILAAKIEAERLAEPAPTPGWKRSRAGARPYGSDDIEQGERGHTMNESNGNGTLEPPAEKFTPYRGVSAGGSSKTPWRAQICSGGKVRTLGYWADPADAARAYDAESRRLGRLGKLNFPDEPAFPGDAPGDMPAPPPPPRPSPSRAPMSKPSPAPCAPLLREIEALGRIAEVLDGLESSAVARVVRYLASAYSLEGPR